MVARAVVVVAAVVTACAQTPDTPIVSARSPHFKGQVTNLYVISEVGRDEEISQQGFERELAHMTRTCGIKLGISHVSRLDLYLGMHVDRAKEFGAEHVLLLRQSRWGSESAPRYDATLFAVSQDGTVVWRADIQLARNVDDPAMAFAWNLLAKLKADEITGPCSALDNMNPADEAWKAREARQRARGR